MEKSKKFITKNIKKIIYLVGLTVSTVLLLVLVSAYSKDVNSSNFNNLKPVLSEINSQSLAWNSSSIIESCSTTEIDKNFNIISIGCNIYSYELNQTRLALWKDGKVSLSNPISLSQAYKESFSTRRSILNIEKIDINLSNLISNYIKENSVTVDSMEFSIDYSGITKFDKENIGKFVINPLSQSPIEIYIDLTNKNILK